MPDWIFVLDNADDKSIFFPSPSSSAAESGLATFLPHGSTGTIIVSTRDREVALAICRKNINVIAKYVMPEDDALKLFQDKYDSDSNRESSLKLLEALAYLPLAIVQAASYMQITNLNPSEYLDRCKSNSRTLLGELINDINR